MKFLVALAVVAALAVPARAEDALSVGLGWATFSTVGVKKGSMAAPALSPDVGGAGNLTYEHGLGTDLSLRADLGGGMFYGGIQDAKKQTELSYALLVDGGVTVRFDVLKYVPYAFAGLGAVMSVGGPIADRRDLVVVLGGGLDVLASRARSWGLEARLASFGGDITIFTLGLRGTTRWNFF